MIALSKEAQLVFFSFVVFFYIATLEDLLVYHTSQQSKAKLLVFNVVPSWQDLVYTSCLPYESVSTHPSLSYSIQDVKLCSTLDGKQVSSF